MNRMKELTFAGIASVTQGACRLLRDDTGAVSFRRFSAEQEAFYRKRSADFYRKTFCTSGVRLLFRTDSDTLFLRVYAESKSSRSFFNFDLLIDGVLSGSVGNITDDHHILSPDGTVGDAPGMPKGAFPAGTYEKTFALGAPGSGEKTVELVFPVLCEGKLLSLALDDGASLIPVKREKVLLAYGDSITHGYDAIHPSQCYAERTARALGYELYNLAIGGEVFCPGLAACGFPVQPDLITVAYGTNDWAHKTRAELFDNCRGFYRNLRDAFPSVPVFALSPVWRGDCGMPTQAGAFADVRELIFETAAALPGVTALDGTDFIPKEPRYYSSDILHPVDEGFAFYADSLVSALRK